MFEPITWTTNLIALAIVLQSLEHLMLLKTTSEDGIWRWSIIREEFSNWPYVIRKSLDLLLSDRGFVALLLLRLFAALAVVFFLHPLLILLLLLSTILICLRFRGVFNGGSDYMTLTVLIALLVATSFWNERLVVYGALLYLAIQGVSSYFIGGISKLKRKNWRNGVALRDFLRSTIYQPSPVLESFAANKQRITLASWGLILFECAFPLALLNSTLCLAFLGAALTFHLLNFYAFGLNRFVFAWLASYPAIYTISAI